MTFISKYIEAELSAKVGGIEVALRKQNVVYVSLNPGPGEFSSITAAIASVSGATASNPFLVSVGPGLYTENQLVMQPYVWVQGADQDTTVIQANTPTDHLVLGADFSGISRCLLTGVSGAGKAAVYYSGANAFYVEDVRFGSNNVHALADAVTATCAIFLENCKFGAPYAFDQGFIGQGAFGGRIVARNCTTTQGMATPYPSKVFYCTGLGSEIVVNGVQVRSGGLTSGACFDAADGGKLRVLSANVSGFSKGLWVENVGVGPVLRVDAIAFEGNTMDLVVDHPGATGYVSRPVEYLKIYIDPASSVYIPDKNLHVITVSPSGSDFTSVTAAIAAAVAQTPSATNVFTIAIGPGTYVESQIVMHPYVSLTGNSTILTPSNPADHLLISASNSDIFNIVFKGVTGAGKAAVYNNNSVSAITDCNFVDCAVGILNEGTNVLARTVIEAENCLFSGASGSALICNSVGGASTVAVASVFSIGAQAATATQVKASGTGAVCVLSGVQAQDNNLALIAVEVEDGATLRVSDTTFQKFLTGIQINNVGAAPTILVSGGAFIDCTSDILVNHPGTTGAISAVADEEKSTFDPGTVGNISLLLTDPDGHIIIGGGIKLRQPDNRFTDFTTLIIEDAALGVLTDGDISPPVSGFTVTIAAGLGYLQKPDGSLVKVTWPDTDVTLPASQTNYLYFDNASVAQYNPIRPDTVQNIVLGRVVTNSTGIELIDESGIQSRHFGNFIGDALRYGIGAVYATGSIVSELGVRTLNVSAGAYYYGERKFSANGGSPVTFTAFYRDGSGGYTRVPTQTTVDNAFWDDGSGTLAAIGAGNWAKHSLYALGDATGDFDSEAYFLVYSQAQYTALTLAEQGSLPNPPSFLSEAVALIASVIVQAGTANIVEVRDERPVIGSNRVSSVAAATFHSNLLGLTVGDDHPQYWRNDGTHVATGDFNLGTHNITNLGTANGVVVENHHARHQPGGADAIPTAAPSANLSATTTNAEGVSTSISRADHSHAISTGVVSSQTPDQANAAGTSANLARADHVHNIATAAPTTNLSATTTNSQGTAATFARSDHGHAISTGAASTQTPDQVNAAGTSANLARADHVHNIATAVPVAIGTANAQGTSTSFARADHVHDHGAQTSGTLHAVATTSVNGFMSASDKTKLDAINGDRLVKAGTILAASFTGTPRKATVTFGAAFPDTNYSFVVLGADGRFWQYESKTAASIVVNTSANAALSGDVMWMAINTGEAQA